MKKSNLNKAASLIIWMVVGAALMALIGAFAVAGRWNAAILQTLFILAVCWGLIVALRALHRAQDEFDGLQVSLSIANSLQKSYGEALQVYSGQVLELKAELKPEVLAELRAKVAQMAANERDADAMIKRLQTENNEMAREQLALTNRIAEMRDKAEAQLQETKESFHEIIQSQLSKIEAEVYARNEAQKMMVHYRAEMEKLQKRYDDITKVPDVLDAELMSKCHEYAAKYEIANQERLELLAVTGYYHAEQRKDLTDKRRRVHDMLPYQWLSAAKMSEIVAGVMSPRGMREFLMNRRVFFYRDGKYLKRILQDEPCADSESD